MLAGVWAWQSRNVPAARNIRRIEVRLSGARWAPLAPPITARRPASLAAAGTALRGGALAELRQAQALEHLLADRPDAAIAQLTAMAADSRDATVWNDLGAAHFAAGRLADALAATDQALIFDRRYAESLFNRALILEKFHLRGVAAAAWRDFLAVAPAGGWRDEAQEHLAALEVPPRTFASEIDRHYARLQRGDRAAAQMLLRLDAGDARYFGETEGLARWGEAWLRRDTSAAEAHLTAVRTLAFELAAFNGEALLRDTVAAIDRADATRRDARARGHIACRDGRAAFDDRRLGDAETLLVAAARDLADSPYALQVRLFAAISKFWQARHDEAKAEYQALAPLVPERYAALRGQLEWQRASCVMARAETGTALAHLGHTMAAFERLREHNNVAYLHNITAQVYDGARDHQRAAAHRQLALQVLGKTSSIRLVHALNGMVSEALEREAWYTARALVNVQLAVNAEAKDAELQAVALLKRAQLNAHLGDVVAAKADLRNAASVVASVRDKAHRLKLQTDCDATTALVSNDPRAAIPLLTEVLRYHDQKGWQRLMPEFYLRRGRMHRATGDSAAAAADFEAGIAVLERDRATIAKGESRWGILDAAGGLFDEAIAEALRSGAEPAFAYAERKRARSLADALPVRFSPAKLPPDAVVVEYASLPGKLLVFTVDRDGYRVHESPISRARLTDLAAHFVEALRGGDAAARQRAASELHQHLIAPAWTSIAAHREVVFITDAATSGIPFAALPGGAGRMLVEDVTVSASPSASVYLRARTRDAAPRRTVMIVDSPHNDALERLSGTSAEAKALQAQYPQARRLTGAGATRAAFIEASRQAEVIHFAGHGLASVDLAALVLTETPDDPGFFDAVAISRLSLTHTDVVVLAACDTARGPVRSAEGVLSVTHAFLQAGAPTVIATLWPLDDRDAADFFPRLHRYLARGLPAAEALRLAQLESIRGSSQDRAALWAAVQVVGY
jgi:CHAT domain-containing protein